MSLSIVPFREEHLERVVELFLLSLGDEGGVPTPEYWTWKHLDNPFGASPTLLMMDGEKRVVGIRAFMAWKWVQGGREYQAYRCVDTATHPDYRGKGIFKQLTLDLLHRLGPERAQFIFNTPNEMSKPGYLKMGWEEAGKVPLYLRPVVAGLMDADFRPNPAHAVDRSLDEQKLSRLIHDFYRLTDGFLSTVYTPEYFRWRYADIPDLTYYRYGMNEGVPGALCYYRLKLTGKIRELRITDLLYRDTDQLHRLLSQLGGVASDVGATAISVLRPAGLGGGGLLRHGFLPFPPRALSLTKRRIGTDPIYDNLNPDASWNLSSGAVELF
ncbi:GNAT family N-acetyltransferase [Lewinella sp. IMCC34191]|uniref:GNAT family N-acetyltransferase n=1 Tax=Lewinella sp. IMCC34191 TaxID=2259172 RepID=UPI000E279589|nr:GNAT family N-acetyltransferase [Lewinella sp. IMCC34191]